MTRKEVRRKLAQFIADNPQLSYKALSLKLNCAISNSRHNRTRVPKSAASDPPSLKLT